MNKHNLIRCIGLVVVSVSLAACFGQTNPLKTNKVKNSAAFLVKASKYAEQQLNIYTPPGGAAYGQCMNNQLKPSLCSKLYSKMVDYSKSTSGFKGLSTSDLTNVSTWKQIESAYGQIRFDSI
jgi:hypothetical protein